MEYKPKLLSLRFQDATGCNEAKADRFAQQYLAVCLVQILRHLNKAAGEHVYVSLTDLQNQMGDVTVRGQRHYVFNTFQTFRERILAPIQVGSNLKGMLTMAELNYELEELLIAHGDGEELCRELYRDFADEIARDDVDMVPIDMFSLTSFIKGNLNQDRSRPRTAETVNNYLYHALRIKTIAAVNDNHMPHVINESQFGRKYYKGPNLQNTPKIVRHAALGDCHEYDIESSVFAWKYSWFMNICQQQDESVAMPMAMPATSEYLDYKTARRRQLARTVFDSDEEGWVAIIKEAITAIGFGAPARVTGYVVQGSYEPSALNTIIKSKTRLQTFLTDPWVQEFVEEQKSINKIIVEAARLQGMEPHFRSIPELLDRAGRLRPNSVVSYLYQQTERQILEYLIRECDSAEILLTVHDCIYTRRPINLLETRVGIREFGEYFKISHEEHRGYAYDDEATAHRQRIAQEEAHAASVYGTHTVPGRLSRSRPAEFNTDNQVADSGVWYESNSDSYAVDLDPFLADMTEQELREFHAINHHRLGQEDTNPQWVRDLITANKV